MPEIREIQIKSQEAKRGDILLGTEAKPIEGVRAVERSNMDGPYQTMVVTATRGTRNMTYETNAGTVVVPADTDVWVAREVPTEEEEAERRRAWDVSRLRDLVVAWTAGAEGVMADLGRKLADGTGLDHWDLDKLLVAQAQGAYASRILALVARLEEGGITVIPDELRDSDDDRLLTATAIVLEDGRGRDRSVVNPLSRSTSVTSNLVEDMKVWAEAEFRDQLRWHVGETLTARRAEVAALV